MKPNCFLLFLFSSNPSPNPNPNANSYFYFLLLYFYFFLFLFQMAIGILRNQIGFHDLECPGNAEEIEIASTFDYLTYRSNIKGLFQSERKFTQVDDDSVNIETEDEMIRQSTIELCDILSKPDAAQKLKKNNKDKFKISKIKLRVLLDKHSLKNLHSYILNFVRHIQDKVCTFHCCFISSV